MEFVITLILVEGKQTKNYFFEGVAENNFISNLDSDDTEQTDGYILER